MILNVTLKGDKELIARIDEMPRAVQQALRRKVTELALRMEKYVKTEKLDGQVLNRIKGRLARSITNEVTSTEGSVMARVFSTGDVPYAAIHEFGFQGVVEVKEHYRHVVFGKSVAPYAVGPYQRNVNMPERSFLRSSLKDLTSEITLGMKEAVVGAVMASVKG